MSNPIPFNPATLTVSQLLEVAETLRTIFTKASNEDNSAEDVLWTVLQQRDGLCRSFGIAVAKPAPVAAPEPETTVVLFETVLFETVARARKARRHLSACSILSSIVGRSLTIHVPAKMTSATARQIAIAGADGC